MLLKSLNHVAIAVPDLAVAMEHYRQTFGMVVGEPHDLPEHGVTVAVVELPYMKIELMQPLGENSPISKFVEKNTEGGVHHLCFDVADIIEAKQECQDKGMRILGDGEPKIGFHGNPVLFLHPKDNLGVLIELEEIPQQKDKPLGRIQTKVSQAVKNPKGKDSFEGSQGMSINVNMDDW